MTQPCILLYTFFTAHLTIHTKLREEINSLMKADRGYSYKFKENKKMWQYLHLFSVKVPSLTIFVSKPFAPHQMSSLLLGSSISNTALLNGSDACVKKWAKGTANNQSWRTRCSLAVCLQMAWIDSPRFLADKRRLFRNKLFKWKGNVQWLL